MEQLKSLRGNRNCTTTASDKPMSRFLLHIFAAFAEMEREIIREQVRAGLRTAKAQRRPLRRPRRVFRRDKAIVLRYGPRASVGGRLRENARFGDVHRDRRLPFGKTKKSVQAISSGGRTAMNPLYNSRS